MWTDIVPNDNNAATDTFTCDSQTFYVLAAQGTSPGAQTSYIYLGDRWDSSKITGGKNDSLGDSSYVWQPLTVTTPAQGPPTLSMNCLTNWSFATDTGKTSTLPDPIFTLTNGNGTLLAASAPNGNLTQAQPPTPSNPLTHNEEWKIIDVPYPLVGEFGSPEQVPGPLRTPLYEIQNVGSGQVINIPCNAYLADGDDVQCVNFGNPLDQAAFSAGTNTELWQFVSVTGGPNLTLRSMGYGTADQNDIDSATTDGTLVQNPPGDPTPSSQDWTLTEVSSS